MDFGLTSDEAPLLLAVMVFFECCNRRNDKKRQSDLTFIVLSCRSQRKLEPNSFLESSPPPQLYIFKSPSLRGCKLSYIAVTAFSQTDLFLV